MSRKHFQSIANALLASKPAESAGPIALEVWTLTVKNVAAGCSEHNANFNWERFLKACGL